MASFLNENSSIDEFNMFNSFIERLENIITEDLRDLFTSKDSFIWFTMFEKFTQLGIDDGRFADFLRAFKSNFKFATVDGVSFVELDENRGTKDKSVIAAKLSLLTKLMCEYLGVNQEFLSNDVILAFTQENVDTEINEEDIELYTEMLTDLIDNTEIKAVALKNKPSVISIIAFACINDIDLDGHITTLLSDTLLSDSQEENYLNMKKRLEAYIPVSA